MEKLFIRDHPNLGVEFDWLATDRVGHYGYFSTAGLGPIPQQLIQATGISEDLHESIMELADDYLPRIHTDAKHSIHDWVEIAKRGFYAYDWRSKLEVYVLVASPLTDDDPNLPDTLSILARHVILPIEFRTTHGFAP